MNARRAFLLAWCCVLAALAALCTHQAIACFEGGEGTGDGFAGYRHLAIAPIALAALGCAAAMLARAVGSAAAVRQRIHPAELAARYMARSCSPTAIIATTLGATALLWGMESVEQYIAFGHGATLQHALGGSWLGLCMLGAATTMLLFLTRRFAGEMLASLTQVYVVIAAIFAVRKKHVCGSSALLMRRVATPAIDQALLSRGFGLRAPPYDAFSLTY